MFQWSRVSSSTGGVSNDCPGGLWRGMLAYLSSQQQALWGLDLSGSDGAALVGASEEPGLLDDALKHIHHEGIHDVHGLLWETQAHVDLLQHSREIAGEALNVVGAAAVAVVAAVTAALCCLLLCFLWLCFRGLGFRVLDFGELDFWEHGFWGLHFRGLFHRTVFQRTPFWRTWFWSAQFLQCPSLPQTAQMMAHPFWIHFPHNSEGSTGLLLRAGAGLYNPCLSSCLGQDPYLIG